MVSSAHPAFRAAPWLPFFNPIFSMAGSKQSGEGAVSRARVLGAFIGAQRRPLTRLPRSVHSPAKKWESPLPVAAGFFLLRFLPGRLLLQLGGEFVLHFADLVQHFVERFRGQLLACGQRPQHVHQQQAHSDDLGQGRIVGRCIAGRPPRRITSRHHSPSVRPLACAAVSSCAYSSSLTLKPMDFVRSGGFTISGLPLSPQQPRLAAALKNQQVRLR